LTDDRGAHLGGMLLVKVGKPGKIDDEAFHPLCPCHSIGSLARWVFTRRTIPRCLGGVWSRKPLLHFPDTTTHTLARAIMTRSVIPSRP
jgi:hypothetical protein